MKKPEIMKLRKKENLIDLLIVIGIAVIGSAFLWMLWINCSVVYGQEVAVEPPPPSSVDEILYTIDPDQDFRILPIIPPGDWITIPLTAYTIVTLPPARQRHFFFHPIGSMAIWYIPIPGATDKFMRVEAEDANFDGVFVFRVVARLRPHLVDMPPENVTVESAASWWVARIPAFTARAIFAR